MKLTKDTLLAIATYIAHSSAQWSISGKTVRGAFIWTETPRRDRKWDKQAGLDAIIKAAKKDRRLVRFEASAGTFWFTFKNNKNTYEISRLSFPNLVKIQP